MKSPLAPTFCDSTASPTLFHLFSIHHMLNYEKIIKDCHTSIPLDQANVKAAVSSHILLLGSFNFSAKTLFSLHGWPVIQEFSSL